MTFEETISSNEWTAFCVIIVCVLAFSLFYGVLSMSCNTGADINLPRIVLSGIAIVLIAYYGKRYYQRQTMRNATKRAFAPEKPVSYAKEGFNTKPPARNTSSAMEGGITNPFATMA